MSFFSRYQPNEDETSLGKNFDESHNQVATIQPHSIVDYDGSDDEDNNGQENEENFEDAVNHKEEQCCKDTL